MKRIVTTLMMIMLVSTTQLFAQVTPKKEFTLSISEKSIELKPGETKTYDVTINRSKSYKKTKIDLLIASTLPEGLNISFSNGTDPMINRIMTVSASKDMPAHNKTIILKGKSLRTAKGVMLNLTVNADALTSK